MTSPTDDPRAYLAPAAFIDSDADNVVAFARRVTAGETDPVTRAIRLFYEGGARPGYTLPSLAFRLAVENGTRRRRRPVASKMALASAAGTGVDAASPTPRGGASGRATRSISRAGTSGNLRIG